VFYCLCIARKSQLTPAVLSMNIYKTRYLSEFVCKLCIGWETLLDSTKFLSDTAPMCAQINCILTHGTPVPILRDSETLRRSVRIPFHGMNTFWHCPFYVGTLPPPTHSWRLPVNKFHFADGAMFLTTILIVARIVRDNVRAHFHSRDYQRPCNSHGCQSCINLSWNFQRLCDRILW